MEHLTQCFSIWDTVRGIKTKSFDLGGTSASSMSRVMQFRALHLFQVETVIVLTEMWKANESVLTMHHDEMSFKGDAWMSVLLAFDAREQTLEEVSDPTCFAPKVYSGNIVRAIWHQKIPGKDAQTTVDSAICPAVDNLDEIGKALYGVQWLTVRQRLKKRMGCMSDQNTTALLTNKIIGKEFDVEDLIEMVCLMHNLDNTLICAEQRLLTERTQPDKRDNVLINNINTNILEISNRIQNHLMIRCDTDKNRGEAFRLFFENSPNKSAFTDFQRVVGGRRQHLARNVEAVLSRRKEIGQFGNQQFNRKWLVTNPRLLYEYGFSQILLRESLVFVCLSRNFIAPMFKTIGKDNQLMKEILPKIDEVLTNLQRIENDTVYSLRSLLTLTQMYDGMDPHILSNTMLSEAAKLSLIDCTEFLVPNGNVDVRDFIRRTRSSFRRTHISFQDRYFHSLFCQTDVQFEMVLKQYRGVCGVVRMDMKKRYELQSRHAIPKSAFSTNDRAETLNATGKYHEKRAPNISEQTKAALAIHDVNRESWYTYDHLAQNEPQKFQRVLILWSRYCGTYKQSRVDKIKYQKAHRKIKRIHLTRTISNSTNAIPPTKVSVAKSRMKSVISRKKKSTHPLWIQWERLREEYLKKHCGMLVSSQRKGLREILRPFMKLRKTHSASFIKTGGLEKLQEALHVYCERNISLRQQGVPHIARVPPLPNLVPPLPT